MLVKKTDKLKMTLHTDVRKSQRYKRQNNKSFNKKSKIKKKSITISVTLNLSAITYVHFTGKFCMGIYHFILHHIST